VARNTNAAVEGEIIMTDEELQQTIQEISENIDKLSDPAKSLTKKEGNHKRVLLLMKETLERIKTAREKGDKEQEMANMMNYGLLATYGEKHPILTHLMGIKVRSNLFF